MRFLTDLLLLTTKKLNWAVQRCRITCTYALRTFDHNTDNQITGQLTANLKLLLGVLYTIHAQLGTKEFISGNF